MFFSGGIGKAIALLGCLYCILTFYLAIVFIAKDDDVDFSDIRFGAIAVFCVSFIPSFWWNSLSIGAAMFFLLMIIGVVFLAYAIEVGLIVRQAVIATVLFIVMYFPGFWAIRYFLNWLVTDAVTA